MSQEIKIGIWRTWERHCICSFCFLVLKGGITHRMLLVIQQSKCCCGLFVCCCFYINRNDSEVKKSSCLNISHVQRFILSARIYSLLYMVIIYDRWQDVVIHCTIVNELAPTSCSVKLHLLFAFRGGGNNIMFGTATFFCLSQSMSIICIGFCHCYFYVKMLKVWQRSGL